MKSMFSFLMVIFAGIYWLGRVVICICYTLGVDIGIVPINYNIEMFLLFLTLICMIFIVRRNIFGALTYFIANTLYFGDDLYNKIVNGQMEVMESVSFLISFAGVFIPFFILMDIFLNKDGKTSHGKTDWFYKNKEYDRTHDTRADENQYKF